MCSGKILLSYFIAVSYCRSWRCNEDEAVWYLNWAAVRGTRQLIVKLRNQAPWVHPNGRGGYDGAATWLGLDNQFEHWKKSIYNETHVTLNPHIGTNQNLWLQWVKTLMITVEFHPKLFQQMTWIGGDTNRRISTVGLKLREKVFRWTEIITGNISQD